ncbi:hypothetical protein CY34DRAFT_485352 [Suillus luteus UH-Slu-Lm8-n1]|uniref:Unplaced genomic scaffold CY34scaffold_356, whole genome shotgun sequence n=1 Tax=Suillus luteus UH-Slu-Lm8-n1 TaxID=930992 RepID=A0A0D0AYL7_9AGAM|nr:hypothetical protein CY34DRAFT_485352 [Suillus luteus UH-Slu-Lm8-n1]
MWLTDLSDKQKSKLQLVELVKLPCRHRRYRLRGHQLPVQFIYSLVQLRHRRSGFFLSLDLPAPLDVGRTRCCQTSTIRLFYPVRISAKTFFGCENCQHAAPFRLSH